MYEYKNQVKTECQCSWKCKCSWRRSLPGKEQWEEDNIFHESEQAKTHNDYLLWHFDRVHWIKISGIPLS